MASAKKALSTKDLEEFKTILLADQTRLERELGEMVHRNPELAREEAEDAGSDEGGQAQIAEQLGENLSLEEELGRTLKDIRSALSAIEKGTYGICKYCKQPIEVLRLKIRPTSTSCVACKRTLTQEL